MMCPRPASLPQLRCYYSTASGLCKHTTMAWIQTVPSETRALPFSLPSLFSFLPSPFTPSPVLPPLSSLCVAWDWNQGLAHTVTVLLWALFHRFRLTLDCTVAGFEGKAFKNDSILNALLTGLANSLRSLPSTSMTLFFVCNPAEIN